MWLGFSVCLSCFSPHDLSEATGGTPLAVSPLPQFPDSAGLGQPPCSVLHVEKQSDIDALDSLGDRIKRCDRYFRWESLKLDVE